MKASGRRAEWHCRAKIAIGEFPKMFGRLPNVFGTLPNVFGTLPNVFGTLPNVFGTLPKAFGNLTRSLPGTYRPRRTATKEKDPKRPNAVCASVQTVGQRGRCV
jgi:hypothetical protein